MNIYNLITILSVYKENNFQPLINNHKLAREIFFKITECPVVIKYFLNFSIYEGFFISQKEKQIFLNKSWLLSLKINNLKDFEEGENTYLTWKNIYFSIRKIVTIEKKQKI